MTAHCCCNYQNEEFLCSPDVIRPPRTHSPAINLAMTTQSRLKLSVVCWGKRQLIAPISSFYKFGINSWLRATTVRELLVHAVQEADANLSLDDAETITVEVVEHSVVATGRTCATRLLDDIAYEVMEDLTTREFHFVVQPVVQEGTRPAVNAMQVLISHNCKEHSA